MLEKSVIFLLFIFPFRLILSASPQNFERKTPYNESGIPQKVPDELQQILNALLSSNVSLSERKTPEKVPPELQQILDSIQIPDRPILQTSLPVTGNASCDCGIKGSNRIVGGTPAGVTEWPWQAFLYIDNTYMCGGALISDSWVVTAAHCIFGTKSVDIFLGVYNLNNASQAKHITKASSLIVHESYDANAIKNDIALLKLAIPVPAFSTFIKPVCLPYKYNTTDFQGKQATVIGWGQTSASGYTSNILREVQMTVLNRTKCTTWPYRIPPTAITDDNFCMYKLGSDSCQGDSGGPVNWQGTTVGRVYHIGLVSWGYGCARKNWPGVYTRTTRYLNWIDKTAGQSFCNL